MAEIKVLVKLIGGKPYERSLPRTLEAQQELVEGYLECINIGDGIDLWMNEEADHQSYNFTIYRLNEEYSPKPIVRIHGNVYFASRNAAGNTSSLSEKQIKKVLQMFLYSEELLMLGL